MPKIEQYTSQVGAPGPVSQPDQNGEAFGAQVAYQQEKNAAALHDTGDQLINTGKYLADRAGESEVSDLSVQLAQTQADFTNKLQDTLKNAKPGDQNITQGFMDQYTQATDQIRDKIQTRAGQAYFDRTNAKLGRHFQQTADAGQAELAGVQATQNVTSSTQAYEATLASDPASYWDSPNAPGVKTLSSDGIEAIAHGKLSGKQIAQLQKAVQPQLAEAAVRGFILMDPQQAHDQLMEGKWDNEFDSGIKYRMLQEAKVGIAGVQAQQRQAQADRDRALDAQNEATKNQFLARLEDPSNPKGKYSVKDVLNSTLSFSDKKMMIGMMDADGKDKQTTDPAVFNSMLQRAILPEGDPRKITDSNAAYQQVVNGNLTFGDAQKIAGMIQGRRSDQGQLEAHLQSEFLKTAAPQIDKSNPGLNQFDLEGQQRLYSFNYFVQKRVSSQKAHNKPVEELFDPSSKDFLGNYIPRFQASTDDIMKQMIRNTGGSSTNPDDIGKMSNSDLRQLNPKQLTPDQRKAAKSRWDELNKVKP